MKTSVKLELASLCAAASLASPAEAAAVQDLAYSWVHPRLVVVQLMDDTDRHNELYFEREYLLARCEKPFEVSAPALFVEDALGGDGVAFFRQAPLPHARADKSPDYRVDPVHGKIAVLSNSYPCVKLRYSGGRPGPVITESCSGIITGKSSRSTKSILTMIVDYRGRIKDVWKRQ